MWKMTPADPPPPPSYGIFHNFLKFFFEPFPNPIVLKEIKTESNSSDHKVGLFTNMNYLKIGIVTKQNHKSQGWCSGSRLWLVKYLKLVGKPKSISGSVLNPLKLS